MTDPREPLPPEVGERTVRELLLRNLRQPAGETALIAPSHLQGEARLTWKELAERSAGLAGTLLERGIEPGDRVAQLIDPAGAAEAHIVYHATHLLGAINVPLNVRYVDRELAWVLQFTAPRALIFSPRFAPVVARLSELLPADQVRLPCDESFARSCAAAGRAPEPALSEQVDADWIFTSGTTGHPKAVALTHAGSVACGYQAQRLWGLEADSVYQSFAPFFTSTGCHTNLLGCLAAGCTYVVEPEFDAVETPRRIERNRVSSTFWISGVIQLLFDRVGVDALERDVDLSSLRRIAYGGQAMSRSFYERVLEVFERRLGIELVHLWGLTEGGTSGTLLPAARHAEGVRRAGDDGLSIGTEGFNDWVRFRVASEDGGDARPNQVGELCLRGPSVMDRYVSEPEATEEALRDGWLHTGDMGAIDEDGFLYFVDRRKQMIRRGGLNVSSVEVEAVIMEHPAVREVAVVPRPNPILEQDVKAVLAVHEGYEVTGEEIIAFCRERLADYKVPVEVVFIDSLPRNAMNRVVKSELEAATP